VVGDFPGDLGRDLGGVERERVGPDGGEALADGRVAQVLEGDTEAARVGELAVALAGEREVGEAFDGVADIDDEEEGRPAVGGGQVPGLARIIHEGDLAPRIGRA